MSGWALLLAIAGLVAGAAVLLAVLWLLQRVLRPVHEIDRYAEEILAAGLAIAQNLDGLDEILRTRDLGAALAQEPGGAR